MATKKVTPKDPAKDSVKKGHDEKAADRKTATGGHRFRKAGRTTATSNHKF
jgi:hypothetical protein